MVAPLTGIAIDHLAEQGIDKARHGFGTATAGPTGEPLREPQRLTRVKAAAPAEDGARRDEQARGHLVHGVAFMEPEQRLRSMQLSGGRGAMAYLQQTLIVC